MPITLAQLSVQRQVSPCTDCDTLAPLHLVVLQRLLLTPLSQSNAFH